jgi:pilus assembly protein CpaB
MRRVEFLITGTAAIIALLVAVLIYRGLSGSQERQAKVETIEILVANRDIRLGEILDIKSLGLQKWPKDYVPKGSFTRESLKPDSLKGLVAKRPISMGEPITNRIVIDSKNQGALAALLSPGKRAISINVDQASISSGLIVPGDIVDVIVTFQEGSGDERQVISKTALCSVKVLALDQRVSSWTDIPGKKGDAAIPRTATLEVTPEEAEALTSAVRKGTASLSLHSVAEQPGQICRVNIHENKSPENVEIYRGTMAPTPGQRSNVK